MIMSWSIIKVCLKNEPKKCDTYIEKQATVFGLDMEASTLENKN